MPDRPQDSPRWRGARARSRSAVPARSRRAPPPAGSTRRRLGPRPGHVSVVEQLEHRVELLVGLERPVLDRTVRQVAACPAASAAVTADPQPAEVLDDHGAGPWLDVLGGEQEECLVVRVAGPGQLEQPVVIRHLCRPTRSGIRSPPVSSNHHARRTVAVSADLEPVQRAYRTGAEPRGLPIGWRPWGR
jgi:hypothetical protein